MYSLQLNQTAYTIFIALLNVNLLRLPSKYKLENAHNLIGMGMLYLEEEDILAEGHGCSVIVKVIYYVYSY